MGRVIDSMLLLMEQLDISCCWVYKACWVVRNCMTVCRMNAGMEFVVTAF